MGTPTPTLPFRLDGKVALVTGSGRGIGAAIAVELASRGAKVVVNYSRAKGPAEKIVQEIKALGSEAIAIQADVSNVSETVRLFDEAVKHFGKIDIVSSNAGVVSFGHLEEVTEVNVESRGRWKRILTHSNRKSSIVYLHSILADSFSSLVKRTSIWAPVAGSF